MTLPPPPKNPLRVAFPSEFPSKNSNTLLTGDVWSKLRHLGLVKAKDNNSPLQCTIDKLNVYFAQSGGSNYNINLLREEKFDE